MATLEDLYNQGTTQGQAPADPNQPVQDTNFWNNLGVGTYSAANSALLGLPDFLVKVFGGSDALKQMRARHQQASDIGGTIGDVGSFLIPAGGIAKAASLGAKALKLGNIGDKLLGASNAIKAASDVSTLDKSATLGKKAIDLAKRGALIGAEQAVPRAITGSLDENGQLTPQSAAGSALGAGASVLGGAIANVPLGLVGSKLLSRGNKQIGNFGESPVKHALSETMENLDKQTANSWDINTRDLATTARYLGLTKGSAKAAKEGSDYVHDFVQWGLNKGVGRNPKRIFQGILEKNDDDFNHIFDSFSQVHAADTDAAIQAGTMPQWKKDFVTELTNDPEMQKILNASPLADAEKQQMMNTVTGAIGKSLNDPRSVRQGIQAVFNSVKNSPTDVGYIGKQLAGTAHRKLYDFVASNAGPDVTPELAAQAREDYKFLQPWIMHESKDAFSIKNPITANSDTAAKNFAKTFADKMTGQGALGSAVGGIVGAQNATDDQGNYDPIKALLSAGTGLIAGNVGQRLLIRGANKAIEGGLRAINKSATSGKGVISNIFTTAEDKFKNPILTKAAAEAAANAAKAAYGPDNPLKSSAPPTNPDAEAAKSQAMESKVAPEQAQATSQAFSQTYMDTIKQRMNYIYSNYYADQMTPEEFVSKVQKNTNGYTDQNAMATLLFDSDSERAKYLRNYTAFQALKNLDVNKAISARSGVNVPIIGNVGGDTEALKDRQTLLTTIANLVTEGQPEKMTPALMKNLGTQMDAVRDNPALLPQFLQSTGLTFDQLRKIGAV